jgi:hypothetical protein
MTSTDEHGLREVIAGLAAPAPHAPVDDPESYTRQLGGWLRFWRQQRGLSLAQAEELSGGRLKASILRYYETGERRVMPGSLPALAALYGVTVADLLPA